MMGHPTHFYKENMVHYAQILVPNCHPYLTVFALFQAILAPIRAIFCILKWVLLVLHSPHLILLCPYSAHIYFHGIQIGPYLHF